MNNLNKIVIIFFMITSGFCMEGKEDYSELPLPLIKIVAPPHDGFEMKPTDVEPHNKISFIEARGLLIEGNEVGYVMMRGIAQDLTHPNVFNAARYLFESHDPENNRSGRISMRQIAKNTGHTNSFDAAQHLCGKEMEREDVDAVLSVMRSFTKIIEHDENYFAAIYIHYYGDENDKELAIETLKKIFENDAYCAINKQRAIQATRIFLQNGNDENINNFAINWFYEKEMHRIIYFNQKT